MASSLIEAVKRFVDFKLALDEQLLLFRRMSRIARVRARWSGLRQPDDYYCNDGLLPSICPMTFTMLALPFSQASYDYDKATCVWVDPAQVVSGTYRRYEGRGEWTSAQEAMDWLDLLPEQSRFDSDTARYAQVGSLPLYVALEGKNRVSLYRKQNRLISALVTETPWPDAQEMEIRRVRPFGLYALWRNKQGAILPFAEAALPLLNAYGVKFGRDLWSLDARAIWTATRACITSSLMVN